DVAELGRRQLICSRQCGHYSGHWITRLQETLGTLMEPNVIAIGGVIFWGESVWRVHEPSPDKCQGYDGYDRQPTARAPPQRRNADDDHEWSRRQKVTRQQRAPQDSHSHHIKGDYGEKRIL